MARILTELDEILSTKGLVILQVSVQNKILHVTANTGSTRSCLNDIMRQCTQQSKFNQKILSSQGKCDGTIYT